MVFFPLVAGLAVLAVYGVIELGLAMTGRWERDLMRRMEHHRQHQPNVLVTRYEERLRAVRTALKERGYPAGPSDAVMNSHTAEALAIVPAAPGAAGHRPAGSRHRGGAGPRAALALAARGRVLSSPAMEAPPRHLAASHALWERARRVMPGGVYGHQNGAALGDGHPRFLARA